MVRCMYRIDLLLGMRLFFLLAKGLMLRLLLGQHLFLWMWLVLRVCGSLGFPLIYFSMFCGSFYGVADLNCVSVEYVL